MALCSCAEYGPWSPAELAAHGPDGLTLLHRAARDGHAGLARALVSQGADVSAGDDQERTPLHWAAIAGEPAIARHLLDSGARIEARSWYDLTPLHWAAMRGRPAIVETLIARGADLGATDFYGRTPLHLAADATAVKLLLSVGAPLDALDHQGMSPLHWVRTEGGAKALIDAGANAALEARDGRRPIDMVIAANDDGPQELLVFPEGHARVRGERGRLSVRLASVTERPMRDLTIAGESHAATVEAPEPIEVLNPGQVRDVALSLRRRAQVPEGEHLLMVTIAEAGRQRAGIELRIDTRAGTTPEDRGMTRVGTVQVQSAPGGLQWLAYGSAPLVLLVAWAIARWRKRRSR
ncbi:MAG: ankyrin repeat domain-containing protein [Deltaproteobacteria bacterium]|jgi:hypothetical protein|nr:ankyrin repeat domain-containing protein [Deltaproteobacteria bacterium]